MGDESDDVRVGGEELGDVVPQRGEEDDVQGADEDGGDESDFGRRAGGRGEGGADEVGDARAGRDGDGEGDLEGDAIEGGEDGLGGQVGGAEVGGREGEDFEGQPFGFDHDEAWQREANHRTPVVEGARREAVPAGAAVDEADVEEEGDGEEGVGYYHCDGSADEPPFELLGWV